LAGVRKVVRSASLRRKRELVTLRVLPLESLPAALTVKGAGGEKQPGRTPTVVLRQSGIEVVRVVAVPQGRAGVVRIVNPGAAAQQLNDPPSTSTCAN
jgi:hypothetical protein